MSGSDHATQHQWARPNTLVEDWASLSTAASAWVEGQRLGPFVLKRALGEGGMGMVWLAEQQQPFVRDVAIKVMRRESHSPLAEAYFEIERQALAQLSHRAIAQIYDAGRLPDGALFFAMEYVPGEPLHEWLATRKVDARELARLLVEVCQGIQHAHQRGLIHRDIKPGNILVCEVDGVAQPKIIDFGIAIGSKSIQDSQSRLIRIAGTDAYMSPEQKRPDQSGLDARTDVYALGAVLAECLYQLAGLSVAGDGHTSTIWREELGASLKSRRGERPALQKLAVVPIELRAIACKAMGESRESRYDSAAAMAEDLRRWLHKEPVQAMGGGRAYALRCLVRRNALASVAISLIVLALLGGVVMALYGLREARAGRLQAEAALALAEQRRNDAEGLVEFMLGDFAEKLRGIGRLDLLDAVGKEALAYLAKEQAEESEASALRRARAYRTIAGVQISRFQMDEARSTLTLAEAQLRPYKAQSRDTDLLELASDIAFRLGRVSFSKGELAVTEPLWQEHLQLARRAVELDPQSLSSKQRLSNALLNMAALEAHVQRSRIDAALTLLDESIALKAELLDAGHAESRRQLANAWAWRASVLLDSGRDAEGWRDQLQALGVLGDAPPPDDVDANDFYMRSEIHLSAALIAIDLGRHDDAQRLIDQALTTAAAFAGIDGSDMRSQGSMARIAMYAAALSLNPEEVLRPYRNIVAQCLRQAECTQQYGQELQALDLLLRSRMGQPVTARELQQVLAEILKAEQPKLSMLRHAFALASLLVQRGDLPVGTIESLRSRLDEVPAARHASLRYALLRLDYLRLSEQDARVVQDFEAEIEARRELSKRQLSEPKASA